MENIAVILPASAGGGGDDSNQRNQNPYCVLVWTSIDDNAEAILDIRVDTVDAEIKPYSWS